MGWPAALVSVIALAACSKPPPFEPPGRSATSAPPPTPSLHNPDGFVPGPGTLDELFGAASGATLADRVDVWSFQQEGEGRTLLALVELYRHAPRGELGVRAWADQHARALAGVVPPADVRRWFNYHTVGRDDRGRAMVEWAWVSRGERIEVYDHLVAFDDATWHVRLSLHGPYAPALVTGWLTRVFDETFGAQAPRGRRVLAGARSPR